MKFFWFGLSLFLGGTEGKYHGIRSTNKPPERAYEWTCPVGEYNLELVHLQDATGSFDNDFVQMRKMYPDLLLELQDKFAAPKFAISAFQDKSCQKNTKKECFMWGTTLSTDTGPFLDYLNGLETTGGGPEEESTPDALLRGPMERMGWTVTDVDENGLLVLRVIILTTDAEPQRSGDAGYGTQCDLPPSLGDGNEDCEVHDYPAMGLISEKLQERNVQLLFLVTKEHLDYYWAYLEELNVPGHVQEISENSEDIIEVIMEGIEYIVCSLTTPEPPTTIALTSTLSATITTQEHTAIEEPPTGMTTVTTGPEPSSTTSKKTTAPPTPAPTGPTQPTQSTKPTEATRPSEPMGPTTTTTVPALIPPVSPAVWAASAVAGAALIGAAAFLAMRPAAEPLAEDLDAQFEGDNDFLLRDRELVANVDWE